MGGLAVASRAYTTSNVPGAAPSASATANTAAIQAALNAANTAGGGKVTLSNPGTYLINSTLLIYSNTTFVVGEGVEIKASPLMNAPLLTTAAYARADINVSTLTSSGNVATCSTASAHGLAVGDFVAINWALPEFYAGVHEVLSTPSSTQFTYTLHATPSNATASAGTGSQIKMRKADKNISVIVLGSMNYDSSNQTATNSLNTMNVILSHVFNLEVTGTFINAAKYNCLVACARKAYAHDMTFLGNSDGLHVTGPIIGMDVHRLEGRDGDNILGCGSGDYTAYLLSEGAVSGFKARQIVSRNNVTNPVRVWGTSAYSWDGEIDGVYGSCTNQNMFQLLSDTLVVPDGNSWIRNLRLKDVRGDGGTASLINLQAKTMDNIEVDGFEDFSTNTTTFSVAIGNSTTPVTATNIVIKNGKRAIASSTGGLIVVTASAATVSNLVVQDCVYLPTNGAASCVEIRDTVTKLTIVGGYGAGTSGQGSRLLNVTSVGVLTEVALADILSNKWDWIINYAPTTNLEVSVSNCTMGCNTNNPFRMTGAGGVMKVRSAGSRYPSVTQAFVRTSTGTFEAYGWDIPCDPASAVMATTNGQFCNSTNATAAKQGMAVRAPSINAWYAIATGVAGVNTAI